MGWSGRLASPPLARRGGPPQRDIAWVRLSTALEQQGCPVCRLGNENDRRGLWILLWERVNDPAVREELRLAQGFCPAHWRRLDGVARTEWLGALGPAILAQDVIQTVARSLARALAGGEPLSRALDGPRPCPVCVQRRSAERDYLYVLARWVEEEAFWERYRRADGLCLPHLAAVPAEGGAVRLLEDGRQRLEALRARLGAADEADWGSVEGRFWGWRPAAPESAALNGCALCRRQAEAERLASDWLLSQSAPRAVCPHHATWLRAAPGGTALLVGSYLQQARAVLEEIGGSEARAVGSRRRWGPRGAAPARAFATPPCQMCSAGDLAVAAVAGEGLSAGPGELVCLPHLRWALGAGVPGAVAAGQLSRLEGLAESLGEFIRKSDWNHRFEPRGAEQGSWPRARKLFAGLEGWAAPDPGRSRR